jgi:general transcription factor 3C polypeptide 5 (transcription factor C subunit 1)
MPLYTKRDAVEKMREFKFNPGRGWKPNEEFIPAPKMTNHEIPQNWGWHQNSNIFRQVESKTGEDILVNRSKPEKFLISYLRFNVESVPQASPFEPPDDPRVQEIVAELNEAFKERPIWSRRALLNHLSNSPVIHLVKAGIQHIGYQFKGGPFRECVIRYGLDPRTDPTCRKYQTIFFKIYEDQRNSGMQWHDIRTTYSLTKKGGKKGPNDGHLFDGKKVTLDGKLWQLCDISDPLLASLIESSPYSTTFEIKADGWYPNGSMAKIRSIMRAKIQAIRQKKILLDGDFARALEVPDEIPGRKSAQIQVPIPDDGLTAEELEKLKQKGEASVIEENGIRRRIHKGKMRSERIRSRVGVRKEERRTRTSRGTQADAKPTAKYLRELHDEADNSNGMSVVDPRLFAAGADALIGEDGSHGSAGLQADKDDNSTDDGDEEQESDAVEDGDEDEEDEEDNDEEDDEDGLEDIPAPTLRAGDTGSRPTGSAKFAMAKSKSDHSTATHGSPASGTSSVNGLRYTPAPVDLSTFRNIAPRPPPP